ncbi:DNA-3-methyladenine glycosylase 2 family protein [Herbiconiux sp. YIM B11900]|uniref:DNA-3-methyladenine glycosylase 2 family protein n=1 Tax=Herbiconiux sp. YIM B11900 TaxID=3404131 RepID=UPI003F863E97
MDFDERYRIILSRDARFDGQFITAVRSTGIYCRPSCPARTPKPANVTFYETSAAAHEAGYRACKRCLPEAVPGTPAWNLRDDLAARAMRLIGDGVVERDGVDGLAERLGYSSRHLTRVLREELGAGPLALSRAHRAQTARTLITGTDLSMSDIAFAAGFASIRQFNDTVSEVFRLSPTQIRERPSRHPHATPGAIRLELPYREPFDAAGVFAWLAVRAIPGIESALPDSYSRSLMLPGGPAWFTVRDGHRHLVLDAHLTVLRDLPVLVARIRRLFDLDADPVAIDAALARADDGAGAGGGSGAPAPGAALVHGDDGGGAGGGSGAPAPGAALVHGDDGGGAGGGSDAPAPGAALVHGDDGGGAGGGSDAPAPGAALVHGDDGGGAGGGSGAPAPDGALACDGDLAVVGGGTAVADPAIGAALLAGWVRGLPGIRMPGAVDPHEMLFRAILGQQITVAAARTLLHRLAVAAGSPFPGGANAAGETDAPAAESPDTRAATPASRPGSTAPDAPAADTGTPPTLLFPTAAQIAEHARAVLTGPRAKIDTVVRVAELLTSGELELGFGDDPVDLRRRLTAIPGIGEWTAGYLAMRVLGSPDVLLTGDVAVRTGARRLGIPDTPRGLTEWSAPYAPWRSYLCLHLWRAAADPALAPPRDPADKAAPRKRAAGSARPEAPHRAAAESAPESASGTAPESTARTASASGRHTASIRSAGPTAPTRSAAPTSPTAQTRPTAPTEETS